MQSRFSNGVFIVFWALLLASLVTEVHPMFYRHFMRTKQTPIRHEPELSGRFLHITDIHIDPFYLESSDPTQFCHQVSPNPILNVAGKFGILGGPCDTPYILSNATFAFMRERMADSDFILYTGDSIRHDRDGRLPRTPEQVLRGHATLARYFAENFDLRRVKFIPTLGNNDAFRHDQLPAGPNLLLLRNLTEIWRPFGLNLTDDFLRGGYFRQDLHQRLSVLSLNSLYLYRKNLQIADCDVMGSPGAAEIAWLEAQLRSARDEGRRVYLIQHVPPLDNRGKVTYYPACSRAYVNLIGKYASVIYGHYTGHTDSDTLTFITKPAGYRRHGRVKKRGDYGMLILNGTTPPKPNIAENIVLTLTNAPSFKPTHNPAIREYTYSTDAADFGAPLDYVQYFTNLTKANERGRLSWQAEYVASRAYGVRRVGAHDWASVVHTFSEPQSEAWQMYKKHITVSGP